MNKSTITSQLPTKLFNSDSYEPLPLHSNGFSKNQFKNFGGLTINVYGSTYISKDYWLIPLTYLDYAQITVYVDLAKLLFLTITNTQDPYIQCLFGVHKNPEYQGYLRFRK